MWRQDGGRVTPEPDTQVKVLSIVGAGRSGTTVLASILGEIDGFTSAGELRWLWERGVIEGRPCGCGAVPAHCPVWSPVVARVMDELGAATTVEELVAAQHELARWRHLPRLLRSVNGPDRDRAAQSWPALGLVRRAIGTACTTLADVTGARVVIDTSKRPVDTAVLAGVPGVDLYVLHLLRDPRAVVHSWRRAKTYTVEGRTVAMGTRGLPATVRRWTTNSMTAEALRRRLPGSRWLSLRYEDFAAHPRRAVDSIMELLQEPGRAPFLDDHTVALGPNHIVMGNPSRFTTGSVAIRSDQEWRRAMPGRERVLVAAMTAPLAARYGYLRIVPPSRRAR
jgi:hypothetical protein